uniref:Uncharacterized protein n=1 Tax=uncultured marine virus TaxID=186617 RepID=A0A0F7L7I3_9VIRU|nr:hypothetical protein [uncultured marine virus]
MLIVDDKFKNSTVTINKRMLSKELREIYDKKFRRNILLSEATQDEMSLLRDLGNSYISEKKSSK